MSKSLQATLAADAHLAEGLLLIKGLKLNTAFNPNYIVFVCDMCPFQPHAFDYKAHIMHQETDKNAIRERRRHSKWRELFLPAYTRHFDGINKNGEA